MKSYFIQALALSLFILLSLGQCHGQEEEEGEPLPIPLPQTQEFYNVLRYKRDLGNDVFDAAGSLGVGDKFLKKFRTLVQNLPPKMQDALISQDFSNVTEEDMRSLNVTVMEYLPPKVIAKLNVTLLNPVIDKLMQYNRPMAMGRVMSAMGDKMDANQLLDKLRQHGGIRKPVEAVASVILYTAMNKIGDKGGLDSDMVNRLTRESLLSYVPEEQLMKVKDSNAAKDLLRRLYPYQIRNGDDADLKDVDDQALIYKLTETAYGKADAWTAETLRDLNPRVVSQLPAQFLKDLNPEAVGRSIGTLKETKFENPMQGKVITDLFLKKLQIENKQGGSGGANIIGAAGALGPLAAFMNPGISMDQGVLETIVQSCDKMNMPAPLEAVNRILKDKLGGRKGIKQLDFGNFMSLGGAVLKNSPPQVVSRAMEINALNEQHLKEIAGEQEVGTVNTKFFQGVISQVASYAVKFFTGGGRGTPYGSGFDIRGLPGAFLGALGIKGIANIDNRNLNDELLDKLRKNPDSMDDAQKSILLKRLKDYGLLDTSDLPPELRALQPRRKGEASRQKNDVLKGLPSDSELRLAYGYGRKYTISDLQRDPYLVGTLSPKHVTDMDIEEIPAILSEVRKSKDGPQQQTLEALSKRFAEYIRLKAEDFDAPDKKLLKYVSPAEASKLPATVLAYFIDPHYTGKLPPQVRKEIMIAMGELSTKDHASIPAGTREEIIRQGLSAIDQLTKDASKKRLDVTELAAIGVGVADLESSRIDKLTPVAAEQAFEVIQGTADDDDDGLKQKACLSKDQRNAWRKKVIEIYGSPSSWDSPTIASLCCLISTVLNENDLKAIQAQALATCRCISDTKPPSHLEELKKALDANCAADKGEASASDTNKAMEKFKSEIAFDLEDLESQIIPGRRKRATNKEKLTCFKVRIAGNAASFTKEQLESLDDIQDCLYELGSQPLSLDNARVLWIKLLKTRDNKAEFLRPEDLRFAGHVLSGIRLVDVKDVNWKDWEIVFPFGMTPGLSKSVLEKMASGLEEKQRKPLSQFTTNDLIVTRNILCGFNPERLSQINSDAFRDALPILKNLDEGCEQTRLAKLVGITMRPEIFGDTSSWTPADVRGVGILLTALPQRALESLPPEAFIGVTPTVASALPPTLLQLLTPQQVENIPRFSAQAMSSSQKDSLSSEARTKLDSLMAGPVSFAVSLAPCSLWSVLSLLFAITFSKRILL